MTASKFPRETARRSLPLRLWTSSLLNVRFATNCHAPTLFLLDTARRAAACIGQLICCQSADALRTFPLRRWRWRWGVGVEGGGGDRRLEWLQVVSHSGWQTSERRADRQVRLQQQRSTQQLSLVSLPLFIHGQTDTSTWGRGVGGVEVGGCTVEKKGP